MELGVWTENCLQNKLCVQTMGPINHLSRSRNEIYVYPGKTANILLHGDLDPHKFCEADIFSMNFISIEILSVWTKWAEMEQNERRMSLRIEPQRQHRLAGTLRLRQASWTVAEDRTSSHKALKSNRTCSTGLLICLGPMISFSFICFFFFGVGMSPVLVLPLYFESR